METAGCFVLADTPRKNGNRRGYDFKYTEIERFNFIVTMNIKVGSFGFWSFEECTTRPVWTIVKINDNGTFNLAFPGTLGGGNLIGGIVEPQDFTALSTSDAERLIKKEKQRRERLLSQKPLSFLRRVITGMKISARDTARGVFIPPKERRV